MANRFPTVMIAGLLQDLPSGDYIDVASIDQSTIDHGSISGLGDDDHTQYHNDTRAASWLSANHENTYNHANFNAAYSHKTTEDAINGLVKCDGASSYSAITDNSSNWDTAYGWGNHSAAGYLTSESDTLNSVTNRGSSTANSVTVGSLTVSDLTSGRIPYVSTSGLLVDSNNLTYTNSILCSKTSINVLTDGFEPSSAYSFLSRRTISDPSEATTPFRCAESTRITSTSTTPQYTIGFQQAISKQVAYGKNDSGYMYAIYSSVFRNSSYVSSFYPSLQQDGGTLSLQVGIMIQSGHSSSKRTESPLTTSSHGLDLQCYANSGAITTYRALYLRSLSVLSTPSTWSSSTSYSLNTYCRPSVNNGYYYVCTLAGVSSSSEPTWQTPQYSETNDNGVIWTAILIPTVTNNYGIYQADAGAKNYFNGKNGIGTTSPTALLHIKAGTASANTAPLKLTSGTLNTTAEAGAVEFLSDKLYFTITTSAARKEIALSEGLTSGKIPIATTNGRLTDGQTPLSGTKVYYVSDSDGGTVNRKLTFIDGILTAET